VSAKVLSIKAMQHSKAILHEKKNKKRRLFGPLQDVESTRISSPRTAPNKSTSSSWPKRGLINIVGSSDVVGIRALAFGRTRAVHAGDHRHRELIVNKSQLSSSWQDLIVSSDHLSCRQNSTAVRKWIFHFKSFLSFPYSTNQTE
jgi:hypothetical protein